MLRTDLSASNVSFEVLQDEEKADENVVSDADILNTSMPSPLSRDPGKDSVSDDEDRNELFAILQEASSDEQDEADTQQEDDGDDNEVNVDVEMEESASNSFAESENHCQALLDSAREKLRQIQAARTEQERRIEEASNLFLKQRFEKALEEIKSQEAKQELEVSRLEADAFSKP